MYFQRESISAADREAALSYNGKGNLDWKSYIQVRQGPMFQHLQEGKGYCSRDPLVVSQILDRLFDTVLGQGILLNIARRSITNHQRILNESEESEDERPFEKILIETTRDKNSGSIAFPGSGNIRINFNQCNKEYKTSAGHYELFTPERIITHELIHLGHPETTDNYGIVNENEGDVIFLTNHVLTDKDGLGLNVEERSLNYFDTRPKQECENNFYDILLYYKSISKSGSERSLKLEFPEGKNLFKCLVGFIQESLFKGLNS